MPEHRRKLSPQFRAEAVQMVIDHGRTHLPAVLDGQARRGGVVLNDWDAGDLRGFPEHRWQRWETPCPVTGACAIEAQRSAGHALRVITLARAHAGPGTARLAVAHPAMAGSALSPGSPGRRTSCGCRRSGSRAWCR